MKKLLLVFTFLMIGSFAVNAQVSINKAKARFIYNFTKFFEWPQSERNGDFVMGVLGSNSIYQELDDYTEGKKVIVQDIKVKKFSKAESVNDCHVLFVSEGYARKLEELSKRLSASTLLVSDSNKGIKYGAALNFVLKGNRLKYEFAAANAKEKGLKFSSRIKDMAAKNY